MKSLLLSPSRAAFYFILPALLVQVGPLGASEKKKQGRPGTEKNQGGLDPKNDEQLLESSRKALIEMQENENEKTINNFIAAGVKIAGRLEQGGRFGSAYKLLATTRNTLVRKRVEGYCFDQNEDSFLLMARAVSSAMEIPDLGNAYYSATLFRQEIFDLLRKGSAIDPEALRLLDRHLYALANKYVKKPDELIAIRREIFEKLPGAGGFQSLRNLISTDNIRELGDLYVEADDYANADKIFEAGEKQGDDVAKAKRIMCDIYLNRPERIEQKIQDSLKSRDFRALWAACASCLLIEQSSGRLDKALETAQTMQEFLSQLKRADTEDSGSGLEDPRYLNRLVVYQWQISSAKVRLFAHQKDMKSLRPEAELMQDILLTWNSAAMSPSSTEQQRLRFKELMGSTPFDIWYMAREPEKLASNLALYKGMVVDSLVQDVSTLDVPATFSKEYPPDLTEDIARVMSGIFKQSLTNLKNVSHEQVLEALPKTSAFIDFAKVSGTGERAFSEDRYVAVIYPQGKKKEFEILDLGLAEEIEAKISLFLALVESSQEDPKLEKVAAELAQVLVAPWFEKITSGKEEVILCPDGALSFLNFGALPDPGGKFLAEKIKVNYVSAARDIVSPVVLEKVLPGEKVPRVGIFVDPDFGAPLFIRAKELIASRRSTELYRLPEARLESAAVIAAFQATTREVEVFTDLDASESRLRSSGPYWFLHFGTHGFFNKYAKQNPLQGSGLVMAGAYPNFKSGLKAEYRDDANDGILTAEEISKLDLNSCWLVSVSACQSGMGQSLDGEGVLGLRRGFYRAGAANLLLCLWPIGDKEAGAFVETFYALVGQDVPFKDIYPKTMAKMLREHADKKGITYAIRAAGPFVMSSVWKKYAKP